MAKYLKKARKKPGKAVLLIAVILIAALAAAYVWFQDPGDKPDAEDGTTPAQTQNVTEPVTDPGVRQETEADMLPALEYPLILEGGNLQIDSLFQYDGINPDCGSEEGRDVASVMLTNLSGSYLEEANIALTLTDGTMVNVVIHDLPAGKTVMAFDIGNTSMEADAQCAAVTCEASWLGEITAVPEGIDLAVDGVTITVTNHTGRDIPELVISCRCPLDEEYFGGIAYQYTLNDLPANESVAVEAWDCILGMAEVVRIAAN